MNFKEEMVMEKNDIEERAKELCQNCRSGIGKLVRGLDDMGAEWWHQITTTSGRQCLASDIREGRAQPNAELTGGVSRPVDC